MRTTESLEDYERGLARANVLDVNLIFVILVCPCFIYFVKFFIYFIFFFFAFLDLFIFLVFLLLFLFLVL